MKQLSFSDAEYSGKRKRTPREVFLAEMHRAVPWARLEALIEPHYPKARISTLSTTITPLSPRSNRFGQCSSILIRIVCE